MCSISTIIILDLSLKFMTYIVSTFWLLQQNQARVPQHGMDPKFCQIMVGYFHDICAPQSVGIKLLVEHKLNFSLLDDINNCCQQGLATKLKLRETKNLVIALDVWKILWGSFNHRLNKMNPFLDVLLGHMRSIWTLSFLFYLDFIQIPFIQTHIIYICAHTHAHTLTCA